MYIIHPNRCCHTRKLKRKHFVILAYAASTANACVQSECHLDTPFRCFTPKKKTQKKKERIGDHFFFSPSYTFTFAQCSYVLLLCT